MAPRPKKKDPRPGIANRPLVWTDLTRDERRAGEAAMSTVSQTARPRFAHMAESLVGTKDDGGARQRRYEAASQTIPEVPVTLRSATDARVEAVERAATTHRKTETIRDGQGQVTHQPEDIGGAGWYFRSRGAVDKALKGTDTDIATALNASARLSARTAPEPEKATLEGLAQAHHAGSVNYSPQFQTTLAYVGYKVPKEQQGKQVPFREVEPKAVTAMRRPEIRKEAVAHTTDVNLHQISRVGLGTNVEGAHAILQAKDGSFPDPHTRPKQRGYAEGHFHAVPGSAEHLEYSMRTANLGERVRGEVSPDQPMLDYHGLRDSNSGILSNGRPAGGTRSHSTARRTDVEGHTAEDTWMNGQTMNRGPQFHKVSGDLALTPDLMGGLGKGDPRVTAASVQHAYNHEATVRATETLQRKYDTEYTVPSVLVQETTWAAAQRSSPLREGSRSTADPDWNSYQRDVAARGSAATQSGAAADRRAVESAKMQPALFPKPRAKK